jgi:iron complex outermembrane receptor protein
MKIRAGNACRPLLALVPGFLAALAALAAHAQAPEQIQEVVVTAQKRSENIQDVPIAVTAISSAQLEQKGISSVSQLSNLAPNVNLDAGTPFSGSDTVLSAYIRGIGQNDFAFNLDPGVGVYVDGVYLARSVGANTTMLDVDRVEILKGPQGTLFGRNSIGGAISIVTRDPGHEFTAKGDVTVGSRQRIDTKVSFDVPFTDWILSTISFSSQKQTGYQHRIRYVQTNVNGSAGIPDCTTATCPYAVDPAQAFPAAGYQTASDEGGTNKWSGRAKLVFLVNDAVRITAAGDYLNVDQAASANTAIGINSPQLAAGGLSGISNLCLLGPAGPQVGPPGNQVPLALAAFNKLCTLPRGGLSPTPTPMAVSPPLYGVNADGNPYNNYLPYDSRFQTGNIDTSYATGNSFSKLKSWGIGTTVDWSIGHGMNLKWINAYRDLHWDTGMDLDGSPEAVLQTSFDMIQHQTSEELQLNGVAVDDRLNYAVGAYYFKEAGHLHDFVTFPMGILMIDGPNDLSTQAAALYAHLNFKLTEQWGLTLGGRETHEHKTFQGYQTDDNGLSYKISGCYPPGAPNTLGAPANLTCQQVLGFPVAGSPYTYYPTGPFTQNYNNFSPTAGVEFHINSDQMLYASFSKGYKTGSWTTRLSNPHPTYDSSLHFNPEFARSEELGFKSELVDHRLRLNLAAFHTKYDNIQLNSQQGISPTIVNAGDATIYGFEAEAQALMGGGFSINASAGYTHAKYNRLNNVIDNGYLLTNYSCPESNSNAPAPYSVPTGASNAVALAGQTAVAQTFRNGQCELPKTPKFKSYFGPQYRFSLPNRAGVLLNADWTYIAKEYNDIGNTWQLARPAMSLVNASATYQAPDGQWEFAVGGLNVTDKRYIVSGQNQGGVAVIDASYNAPREWYATVRFRPSFGGR